MSHVFPTPLSLAQLMNDVAVVSVGGDVLVGGITQDSRSVSPGDLYCCVRGDRFNGHDFVADAVARGAVAVLIDEALTTSIENVSVVQVDDVRAVLGAVAANGFGHPAEHLTIVGITGTNGKTSTAAILASILRADGRDVEVLGTLTGVRTTPEAIELQDILHGCVASGRTHVVMEVSSHALHQGRVNGFRFAVGVFTNIARDHLDYHGTEENYFAAKALLFTSEHSLIGVVNIDDPRGQLIVDVGAIPMRTFGSASISHVEKSVDHVSYTWRDGSAEVAITVPMGGTFTVMNSLAAVTAADALGVRHASIVEGCASLRQVPGRFESVTNDCGIGVLVDYAHTPDGLSQVLRSARELTTGQLIAVFGCGGDRDAGKRPLMGSIASELSDVVYVTSDNPRTEDPQSIVDEILAGMPIAQKNRAHIELDRARAIESAILAAQRGDIVVVAGKGHETYQEINGATVPFSDVEVATQVLQTRRGEAS